MIIDENKYCLHNNNLGYLHFGEDLVRFETFQILTYNIHDVVHSL